MLSSGRACHVPIQIFHYDLPYCALFTNTDTGFPYLTQRTHKDHGVPYHYITHTYTYWFYILQNKKQHMILLSIIYHYHTSCTHP